MRVELLADHPHLAVVIAEWHWDEWGHLETDNTLNRTIARISERVHREKIPLAFIAFEGSQPVGTASLVENDMSTRPELCPWLAGVYVLPEFRKRGVASSLVRRVTVKAQSLGYDVLYLYTNSAAELYASLGWQELYEEPYKGKQVKVMNYVIDQRP